MRSRVSHHINNVGNLVNGVRDEMADCTQETQSQRIRGLSISFKGSHSGNYLNLLLRNFRPQRNGGSGLVRS